MKKQLLIIGIILLLVCVGFSIYFFYPSLFEECTSLEDGTKVCGDINSIEILNYTIYTTEQTDFTYKHLGEGFIHSDEATNYYVKVNLKKITNESIDEKKLTVKFLDTNSNFLDSSWMEMKDSYFNSTTRTTYHDRDIILSISRDNMGNNFEKVEGISFRISNSVDSDSNECYFYSETKYNDKRFFGTWINESGEINETCTSLFTNYTFYSNGTGMTPFGKINWKTVVYHCVNDTIGLEFESYYFGDTPYNSSYYRVFPIFEFSNNNNTLMLRAFDDDLYNRIPEDKINWMCWTTMFYTKQ